MNMSILYPWLRNGSRGYHGMFRFAIRGALGGGFRGASRNGPPPPPWGLGPSAESRGTNSWVFFYSRNNINEIDSRKPRPDL